MGERRWVRGEGGLVVPIDIDRDVDQATFDSKVERGDWEEVADPTAKSTKK
jgi:hypothetical protein